MEMTLFTDLIYPNQPVSRSDKIDLDEAYIQMAEVWAKRSKANRLQVGALIVKDKMIISDGYNGMPAGVDDVCEEWVIKNGIHVLASKDDVLHAEANAILKLAKNGGRGAVDATLYVTHSPCKECAKLIHQSGIKRVVYRNEYRDVAPILKLKEYGVIIEKL